jgi:hypothetical protein
VATVALTGFLTLASLLPLSLQSTPYGRRIVEADIVNYPEAGPDGNYRSFDQLPYRLFGIEGLSYFVGPLYGHGDPIVPSLNLHQIADRITFPLLLVMTSLMIVLLIFFGAKSLLKEDRSGGGIRLLTFFVICALLHILSWLGSPYLYIPTRYFMFSLPFLITFVFPWSVYTLWERSPWLRSSRTRELAFLVTISLFLLAFGGRGNVEFADSMVEPPARPLFDEISALPNDALIAGWPVGQLRKVEYVTRRNTFLTGDLHQVLHLNVVEVMRQRMDAIFEAYFSTDVAPLRRLNKEFGVTHLIVDTRDFTDSKHTPDYFSPWRSRIKPRLAEIRGKEFVTNPAVHEKAAIFDRHGFILLDLAKLP